MSTWKWKHSFQQTAPSLINSILRLIHYLTDKDLLNSALIVHEITDIVRVTIEEVLCDVDLETNRVPKELCDVTISIDCDGQDDINAMDAMLISQFYVGLIEQFPVEA